MSKALLSATSGGYVLTAKIDETAFNDAVGGVCMIYNYQPTVTVDDVASANPVTPGMFAMTKILDVMKGWANHYNYQQIESRFSDPDIEVAAVEA